MSIIEPKSIEQYSSRVGDVIVVRVLEKQKIGRLSHIYAAVAKEQPCSEIEAICERRHLVCPPIIVRILKNPNSVAGLCSGRCAQRILIELEHPKPAARIPGHGDRIYDLRLRGEKPGLETWRQDESLLRFRGRQSG